MDRRNLWHEIDQLSHQSSGTTGAVSKNYDYKCLL